MLLFRFIFLNKTHFKLNETKLNNVMLPEFKKAVKHKNTAENTEATLGQKRRGRKN